VGTRGLIGVRLDGKDYLTYNHFDSYPSGLGVAAVLAVDEMDEDLDYWKDLTRRVKVVNPTDVPAMEELQNHVSLWEKDCEAPPTEYYDFLHPLQGDIKAMLRMGILIDSGEFINDSLFCEWAYILNLDTRTLEVYHGWQNQKGVGRYAAAADKPDENGYWPCSLVAEILFDNVTEAGMIELEKTIEGGEEDDTA